MMEFVSPTVVTRRGFLKELAATGASALLVPHLPGVGPLASLVTPSLRIGLLMPSFQAYPRVGASFIDGMALFVAQSDGLHNLQLRAADAGSQAGLSQHELEQLWQEAQPDVVVSMANPSLTDGLQPLLEQAAVPLMISHAGANRLEKQEANVFYNTLGYWQASYRAGAYAADALGRRAVVVSSFYESGYDALYAFEQGLAAQGGQVVGRHVTHVPASGFTMPGLMRRIAAAAPDFVYGQFSGPAAADFVTAYSSSRYTRLLPLLGSTFLMENTLPGPAAGAVAQLKSVSSWSPSLEMVENTRFVKAFRSRYGRAPDSFAVLGYDTAGLLSAAADAASDDSARALRSGFATALRKAQFRGPRGLLAMDRATQSIVPRLYLREVTWEGVAYGSRILRDLPPVAEQLAHVQSDSPRTGWLNPYLSI